MNTQDDEARRRWFRREILPLEGQLRAYAQRFARTAEADDLVQETFARAIACETWLGVRNPAAFTFNILRNVALDDLRRRKVVAIDSVADLERIASADPTPGPEATALWRNDLRRLQELIQSLPPQQRRVFTLRKVYDLSTREIAERLGLSVSTVETHLAKGLQACSNGMAAIQGRPKGKSGVWTGRRRREDGAS